MNTLISYYKQGLILYPRVENGYIEKSLFSYFPHPPLAVVNSLFEPLKFDAYETNENSFLLHLHNLRYMNISQTESVQKLLKKKTKNKSFQLEKNDFKLIENYKNFLDLKNETEMDYFIKKQLFHYENNKPSLIKIDYNSENFIEHISELNSKLTSKENIIKDKDYNIFDNEDIIVPK